MIVYTFLSGLLVYFLGILYFHVRKFRKKRQYKKMIDEKMETLEQIKEELLSREQPTLSPDLLVNVFKENFGHLEYDLT